MKYIIHVMMIALMTVALSSIALAGPQEEQERGSTSTESTMSGGVMVPYHSTQDGEEVQGYFAEPDKEGPYPALILIHEWVGLADNIKAYADGFVAQGYVVLAVDLYNGEVANDTTRARELATGVGNNTEAAFANLKDAISYLQSLDNVDGERLASVGWCFGGAWSYQVAVNNLGVKATVMYYGQFDPEDDFAHMKATILGHFAEDDRLILVDKVKEFQVVLAQASEKHAIYIYPNAGHGFARDQFTKSDPGENSQRAWDRTLEFLKENL